MFLKLNQLLGTMETRRLIHFWTFFAKHFTFPPLNPTGIKKRKFSVLLQRQLVQTLQHV